MKSITYIMWIENGVASVAEYNEDNSTIIDPMWIINREVGVTADGAHVPANDPSAEKVVYTCNLVPYVASKFTGGTFFTTDLSKMRYRLYEENDPAPVIEMYKTLRATIKA